jgi:hypothetical protein
MARFTDSLDREWEVTIDVLQIRRVRERLNFPIGKLLNDGMAKFKELANTPELLVDVLWELVSDQAAQQNVGAESFGRSLVGDALERGWRAFEQAFLSFCPSRQREPLRELLAKTRDLEAAEAAIQIQAIRLVDVTSLTRTLNDSPGSALGSPESIPGG